MMAFSSKYLRIYFGPRSTSYFLFNILKAVPSYKNFAIDSGVQKLNSLDPLAVLRAVPEIILREGWAAGTFLSCGGRVFC